MDLACLDHAYFREELQKLTRLITEVKREKFEARGAKGTAHEWQVLEQIEIQLDNLCILNDQLVQFDIKQRLEEVYSMAETLFKIKTGKLEPDFTPPIDDQEYEFMDFDQLAHGYEDDYNDDEIEYCGYYEDEYEYSKKPKPHRNKNKKW